MSKYLSWGLAALLVASLLSLASVLSAAPPQSPPAQKKWQYAIVLESDFPTLKKVMWMSKDAKFADNASVPDVLNQLGADGWELVQVEPPLSAREPTLTTFYFKR